MWCREDGKGNVVCTPEKISDEQAAAERRERLLSLPKEELIDVIEALEKLKDHYRSQCPKQEGYSSSDPNSPFRVDKDVQAPLLPSE